MNIILTMIPIYLYNIYKKIFQPCASNTIKIQKKKISNRDSAETTIMEEITSQEAKEKKTHRKEKENGEKERK